MNGDLEACLKRSIEQYQGIYEVLSAVLTSLDKEDTAAMETFLERLDRLQAEAVRIDETVVEALNGRDVEVTRHPLYLRRLELIETIMEQNRLISSQARGIMSVVSAELAQIREGKKVVSGYKPGKDTRGTRVHNAC